MIDRVFGGRYRIIERIGIGGMAEVYRATDEVLGRTVAVKVMLPQYAQDPTFAARFKQEAQAAANLQSPYIVNIYDWGRDETDQTFYIVMELVRGTDLKSAINQRGALNQHKAAEVASQVCAALSVAHGYGIIHRDIKPHNIMVQPDGNAKVMDFGIARANGSAMTQTGSVLGTAYYVSPEQAQGKELGAATDLYSLGIVLYEAVTGQLPFEGTDAVTVALKQVNQEPTPPSEINPSIDPDLEAIILKAMEKNPDERYPTAATMQTALNNYLTGLPIDSGIVDSQAQTTVMGVASSRAINRGERRADAASEGAASGGGAIGGAPRSSSRESSRQAASADEDAQIARTTIMPVANTGLSTTSLNNSLAASIEEHRRKNRMPAIIIGVLIGLLVIGLGAFIVWNLVQDDSPDTVRVPNVVGMNQDDAERLLQQNDLELGQVTLEYSELVEAGRVIVSNPSSREVVDKGSAVDLVISQGPETPGQKQVPSILNMPQSEATELIESSGFKYSYEGEEFSDTVDAGRICRQSPEANIMVDEGTTIKFWISKGKESTTVPSVVNEQINDAERILFDSGFEVGTVTREFSDTVPKDYVIRQSPTSGTTQTKGTKINLTVSDGPDKVAVPNVIGMSVSSATNALNSANLRVDIQYVETTSSSDVGLVLDCSPYVGTKVDKNSTVTIFVGKEPPPPPPPPEP
ncbi:MAG: Stk1 family PASTA domain-containing Ser/Thr kinase [Coriobacteriia bacterium]|nr:Stk1 family PASTA domain-containing Ser/Thr kinase [Coriobacteriia bacterium]